jgi:hypothetical protein
MWEEAMSRLNQQGQAIRPYPENFLASTPQGSQAPPSWWKDPAHRRKIAHVVHGCDEPERQRALSLANERNAGLVFVMDQRGGPNHNKYDHLPNYFGTEVSELNSYLDFGFDPLRALRAASRYALANKYARMPSAVPIKQSAHRCEAFGGRPSSFAAREAWACEAARLVAAGTPTLKPTAEPVGVATWGWTSGGHLRRGHR